jgi:hypothetical protein
MARHGLWTEVKERVDYREEGSRKGGRNVGGDVDVVRPLATRECFSKRV